MPRREDLQDPSLDPNAYYPAPAGLNPNAVWRNDPVHGWGAYASDVGTQFGKDFGPGGWIEKNIGAPLAGVLDKTFTAIDKSPFGGYAFPMALAGAATGIANYAGATPATNAGVSELAQVQGYGGPTGYYPDGAGFLNDGFTIDPITGAPYNAGAQAAAELTGSAGPGASSNLSSDLGTYGPGNGAIGSSYLPSTIEQKIAMKALETGISSPGQTAATGASTAATLSGVAKDIGTGLQVANGINTLTGGALANGLTGGSSTGTGTNGSTQSAVNLADPFNASRAQYGTQLNNLMANPNSVTKMPGYQFQMDQGRQQLQRGLASTGQTQSGQEQIALQQYGQGLAGSYFDNMYAKLARLSGADWQAGASAASASQNGQQFAYDQQRQQQLDQQGAFGQLANIFGKVSSGYNSPTPTGYNHSGFDSSYGAYNGSLPGDGVYTPFE